MSAASVRGQVRDARTSAPIEPLDPDGLSRVRSSALRDAARRVVARWGTEVGEQSDAAEVEVLLGSLARAIERGWERADSPVDSHVRTRLGLRVLEQLRVEVTRGWLEWGAVPEDTPAILVGIERLREVIELELGEQLAGPDGLEVLLDIAHDLRSPLTSIMFLADTLQRGQSGPVNELQARQLGLIYGAALGLSSAADDIIGLSLEGLTLVEQEAVPFSIAGVLGSVRDIVHPMAEERNLAVHVAVPEVERRLGHPVALSRVLLNLTTNALKFTERGLVEISAEAKGPQRVEFGVCDTGKGIKPGALHTLYAPLRRAPRRSGLSLSQTGLGLAMCRKLVEAMGSELAVESRVGRGTRFSFELVLPPCPAGVVAVKRSGSPRRRGQRRRS